MRKSRRLGNAGSYEEDLLKRFDRAGDVAGGDHGDKERERERDQVEDDDLDEDELEEEEEELLQVLEPEPARAVARGLADVAAPRARGGKE